MYRTIHHDRLIIIIISNNFFKKLYFLYHLILLTRLSFWECMLFAVVLLTSSFCLRYQICILLKAFSVPISITKINISISSGTKKKMLEAYWLRVKVYFSKPCESLIKVGWKLLSIPTLAIRVDNRIKLPSLAARCTQLKQASALCKGLVMKKKMPLTCKITARTIVKKIFIIKFPKSLRIIYSEASLRKNFPS
jgi:hypothetical protein